MGRRSGSRRRGCGSASCASEARAAGTAAAAQFAAVERVGRDRQQRDVEAAAGWTEADAALAKSQAERVAALRRDGLAWEKALAEAQQAAQRADAEHDTAARAL